MDPDTISKGLRDRVMTEENSVIDSNKGAETPRKIQQEAVGGLGMYLNETTEASELEEFLKVPTNVIKLGKDYEVVFTQSSKGKLPQTPQLFLRRVRKAEEVNELDDDKVRVDEAFDQVVDTISRLQYAYSIDEKKLKRWTEVEE